MFKLSLQNTDRCIICFSRGGYMINHHPWEKSPGYHSVHASCLQEWCLHQIQGNFELSCPCCRKEILCDLLVSGNTTVPSVLIELAHENTVQDTAEQLLNLSLLNMRNLHLVVIDLHKKMRRKQHHRRFRRILFWGCSSVSLISISKSLLHLYKMI